MSIIQSLVGVKVVRPKPVPPQEPVATEIPTKPPLDEPAKEPETPQPSTEN